MFSAYSIRKILPRLLIAVIAIQLSWWIVILIVNINNNIAHGLEALFYVPFGGANTFDLATLVQKAGSSGDFSAGIFAGATIGSVAFLAAGPSSLVGILALAGTAAFAALMAVFTLILRRAVLIFLIVMSPLAIVAWVLPGTERGWKIWWESFSKLLLMYPLILLMIASGRVFAYISVQAGGTQFITFMMVILGFFGPLLFIPKTIKMSGAAFSSLAGAVNSRNKGVFGALSGVRANQSKRNRQKFLEGERFSRDNMGARAFRRVGAGFGAGAKGHFGVGRQGAAGRAQVSRNAMARQLKENSSLQQFMLSDDDGGAVLALSGGTNGGAVQAAADLRAGWAAADPTLSAAQLDARHDRALAAARAQGISKSTSQAGFQLMMQNKARSVAGGEAGRQMLQKGVNRLHDNNAVAATEALESAQYFGRESGRSDLGGSSVMNGFDRTGAYKVARGYSGSLQAHAEELQARYTADIAAGNTNAAFESSVRMTALRNAMGPDVTEENKAIITTMFNNAGLDTTDMSSIDEQFGEQLARTTMIGPPSPAENAAQTQRIRNRAGLYDQGDPALRTPGGPIVPSDRRLKKNIQYLITNQSGIKLYRFQYIWGSTEYVGVMAQDLIGTYPDALSVDSYGYFLVNYDVLGLTMLTYDEWQFQNTVHLY